MRNLLMLLVAVLGTSAMVQAFPAKDVKAASAKEITTKKHHKHNKAKKEQKMAAPEASSSNAKK
ncbi:MULTISPECIES: hypothetical protein [Flavobacterium]|uniref:hypothetical protein n=1 Tax=Flavobacterium TaxID=237 RepID=UPI00188C760B|nr:MULTISPECIES: hypothetical protein [Flavobacterium]MBF4472233.1 hypothetical protein [Flavobacterium sp. HJJ]